MATEHGYKFVSDYPGVSHDVRRNPSSSNRGAIDRPRNWHLCIWRNRDQRRNVLTFHGPANYFTVKRAEPNRSVSWSISNANVTFTILPKNPGGGGPR